MDDKLRVNIEADSSLNMLENNDKENVENIYPVNLEFLSYFNFTIGQANISFFDSVSLSNNSDGDVVGLKLNITFEYDYFGDYQYDIGDLQTGDVFYHEPRIEAHSRKIYELNETITDSMLVKITSEDGLVDYKKKAKIEILPPNQWLGVRILPSTLSSFVMPNIPQVKNLLPRVSQILKENTGKASITAYQTEDKNAVLDQMAAIYGAIYEQNISYFPPPASLELIGQRVRTSDEVLDSKIGTCIEMATLFCSLAEACGLHPFIVLIKGHAFAGVWLKESMFANNQIDDYTEISKRLSDGINDIEVVECTYMNQGMEKNFNQAIGKARDYLEKTEDFICVVDVYRSHLSGFRPLPIVIHEEGERKIIDYGLADDAEELGSNKKTVEEYFLDTSVKDEVDKARIWTRNMLDMSKRNHLISFRPGSKSVQFFNFNISSLEDALSDGKYFEIREVFNDYSGLSKGLKFVDIENDSEYIDKLAENEFKSNRLRTFLTKGELDKRLKTLYRDAKVSMEENGANTLFLALGFLQWIDPLDPRDADGNREKRLAPIILLPVDLVRSSKGKYRISLRDEDPQLNVTLLEMLKQKFELHIGGLDPLPQDESGVDIDIVMNSIRKAIIEMPGWDVLNMSFIGIFSFSQFVMWNDLQNRFDQLTENKVVKGLVEGRYRGYSDNEVDLNDLDNLVEVEDIALVSGVDSSQLAAVIDAANGNSFVLHGPPGTGKSQSITNIIANALYQGKTVLFVAEKMAALNVVHDRLKNIGLDDFVLEMHSNKVRKSDVLTKFGRTLELKQEDESDTFKQHASRIKDVKDRLNREVLDLHRVRNQGHSVYELITIYQEQGKVSKIFDFSNSYLESLNKDKLYDLEILIKEVESSRSFLHYNLKIHPLREWKSNRFSLNNKIKIEKLLDTLNKEISSTNNILDDIRHEITNKLSINQANHMVKMGDLLIDRNFKLLLDKPSFAQLRDRDNLQLLDQSLIEIGELIRDIEELEKLYHSSVLEFNWFEAKNDYLSAGSSFLFKGRKERDALQSFNAYTVNGFEVSSENADVEFDRIARLQERKEGVKNRLEWLSKTFDVQLSMDDQGFDAIGDLYTLSKFLLDDIDKGRSLEEEFVYFSLLNNSDLKGQIQNFSVYIKKLENLTDELAGLLSIEKDELIDSNYSLLELSELTNRWAENLEEWKSWSDFYGTIFKLNDLGLEKVADKILEGREEVENNLIKEFLASLSKDLAVFYLSDSEELSKFTGRKFEAKIKRYNKLVDEFEKLSVKQIKHRLIEQLPNPKTASDEEAKQLALLRRIIMSKGRGTSIRSLFEETSSAIKNITPCMLMSPLSVAQYIDLDFPKFDLVVFDEASQIPTANAVGAMSRANDCIIVGDPNQMPPTSFFKTQAIDEENLAYEDMESLLDDVIAINLPERHLNWHYRSKSESLIAFSNNMYYSNELMTFPSPFDRDSRVIFKNVNGVYDRGLSRTNKIEAKAIVDEIEMRLLDEDLRKDSIGVITFNTQQQNLIDDLLIERLQENDNLAKIIDTLEEPIFIKNLENAQGDERDIILFSICYGKDENEKMYQNFGPINQKGGWRRLNVASSRSRKLMRVYASIEPEDIKVTNRSSEGVKGLRAFLEFAKRGKLIAHHKEEGKVELLASLIEESLNVEGFESKLNVGFSNFKLDLVVMDPRKEDTYLAVLLIDGDQYSKRKTVRDRNRLLPNVLNNMGWDIYNIWILDWFENYERSLNSLISFLNELLEEEPSLGNYDNYLYRTEEVEQVGLATIHLANKNIKEDNGVGPFEKDEIDTIPESVGVSIQAEIFDDKLDLDIGSKKEQVISSLVVKKEDKESILDDLDSVDNLNDDNKVSIYEEHKVELDISIEVNDNLDAIRKQMEEIISKEFPILEDSIYRRIVDAYGDIRLTKSVKQQLSKALRRVDTNKTSQSGKRYYWPTNIDVNSYMSYRLPEEGNRIEINSLCDYELANLIVDIAKRSSDVNGYINLDEDELLKEAARLLGYGRLVSSTQKSMKTGITNAIRRNLIRREGSSLVLEDC